MVSILGVYTTTWFAARPATVPGEPKAIYNRVSTLQTIKPFYYLINLFQLWKIVTR